LARGAGDEKGAAHVFILVLPPRTCRGFGALKKRLALE
jgi:hypothetical protein